MPEDVVGLLEAVDVDQADCELAAVAGRLQHRFQQLVELQPVGQSRQTVLLGEVPELLLQPLALGNLLGQHHHAADSAVLQVPGTHLPANDVSGAVGAAEYFFRGAFCGSGEDALVLDLPALGHIRENFVVIAADEGFVGQTVIVQPAIGMRDVAHVGVEHGDGRGGVLDEGFQRRMRPLQLRFGAPLVRHVEVRVEVGAAVDGDAADFQYTSRYLIALGGEGHRTQQHSTAS